MTTKLKKNKKRGALARVEPDYTERADQASRKSNVALVRQAVQLWKELQKDRDNLSKVAVEIVNHSSQLGGVLVQICGGEQFGFAFWQMRCADQLPFNFEAAKELISVFKKVPEPITQISQIWPVWKQVNMALGMLSIPERLGEQSTSGISPLTAISHSLGQAYIHYQKWEQAEPMADWPKDRLETIVVETKQIHDLHERAAEVLKGKG